MSVKRCSRSCRAPFVFRLTSVGLALAAWFTSAGTATGNVQFFVANPTANSSDYFGACSARGLAINSSIDFSLPPNGLLDPEFFRSSTGALVQTISGAVSVQTGNGSDIGNTIPDGTGEGRLPEPARYLHTGFGGITQIDFVFDHPIAGFGLMTADMFRWGGATPAATIEIFDAAGDSLGSTSSIDMSFEFDYLYYMGVIDDDARISRVRFTNYGIAGDSIYLTQADFAYRGNTCLADIVGIGGNPPPDGLLTGDDFNAFINAFAAADPLADVVSIGGLPPPDGLVTGDDFNAFIAAFAAGCP